MVKEIELVEPAGKESKPIFIAQDLTKEEEEALKMLLKEFRDAFAWTYHDMKGVPPFAVQHIQSLWLALLNMSNNERTLSMQKSYRKNLKNSLNVTSYILLSIQSGFPPSLLCQRKIRSSRFV